MAALRAPSRYLVCCIPLIGSREAIHTASRLAIQPIRASQHQLPSHSQTQTARAAVSQKRWHTAPPSISKVYNFDEVKQLVEQPSEDRILIDVREPAEYAEGYIPHAINIPIGSAPEALFLSADEFEDRFGFEKPSPVKEVVFYCKAGVRSSAAAKLAEQSGYEKIGEYRGSWLDWVSAGGGVERPR